MASVIAARMEELQEKLFETEEALKKTTTKFTESQLKCRRQGERIEMLEFNARKVERVFTQIEGWLIEELMVYKRKEFGDKEADRIVSGVRSLVMRELGEGATYINMVQDLEAQVSSLKAQQALTEKSLQSAARTYEKEREEYVTSKNKEIALLQSRVVNLNEALHKTKGTEVINRMKSMRRELFEMKECLFVIREELHKYRRFLSTEQPFIILAHGFKILSGNAASLKFDRDQSRRALNNLRETLAEMWKGIPMLQHQAKKLGNRDDVQPALDGIRVLVDAFNEESAQKTRFEGIAKAYEDDLVKRHMLMSERTSRKTQTEDHPSRPKSASRVSSRSRSNSQAGRKSKSPTPFQQRVSEVQSAHVVKPEPPRGRNTRGLSVPNLPLSQFVFGVSPSTSPIPPADRRGSATEIPQPVIVSRSQPTEDERRRTMPAATRSLEHLLKPPRHSTPHGRSPSAGSDVDGSESANTTPQRTPKLRNAGTPRLGLRPNSAGLGSARRVVAVQCELLGGEGRDVVEISSPLEGFPAMTAFITEATDLLDVMGRDKPRGRTGGSPSDSRGAHEGKSGSAPGLPSSSESTGNVRRSDTSEMDEALDYDDDGATREELRLVDAFRKRALVLTKRRCYVLWMKRIQANNRKAMNEFLRDRVGVALGITMPEAGAPDPPGASPPLRVPKHHQPETTASTAIGDHLMRANKNRLRAFDQGRRPAPPRSSRATIGRLQRQLSDGGVLDKVKQVREMGKVATPMDKGVVKMTTARPMTARF